MSADRSSAENRHAIDPAALNGEETLPEEGGTSARGVSRRALFRLGALAGAGASMAGMTGAGSLWGSTEERAESEVAAAGSGPSEHNEATIAELQAAMAARHLHAIDLVEFYLARINNLDRRGPQANTVLEINPDARAIAMQLDTERRTKGPRGPLHGIPVLLKDNIDTHDKMQTTAGSLLLLGSTPAQDATVAARLRAAGAVILGKSNLSEWANFRSFFSSSGWCGRGGQTNNPYFLDFNPCGSSSGSAAAVSANFTAVSLGTETDGSIVCPASTNGVVGVKPTLGLTSRAGVIPIAHSQDVVGPHTRTVADAAAVLSALVGVDPRDPATAASAGKFSTDYTQFLDPKGLQGARIGVTRQVYTGYSPKTDAVYEEALLAMKDAGAVLIDPADIPTAQQIATDPSELIVLLFEFKQDLNAYLATRTGTPYHTLADLIAGNRALAAREMPFFAQEIFELADSDPFTAQQYADALVMSHLLSRDQGIDAVMNQFNLDALVAPTGSPSWATDVVNGDHFLGASSSPAAMAGYPAVVVVGGFQLGLPVGITFFGRAWSEGLLLKLAFAFEQATQARQQPKFLHNEITPLHHLRPGQRSAVKTPQAPAPIVQQRPFGLL